MHILVHFSAHLIRELFLTTSILTYILFKTLDFDNSTNQRSPKRPTETKYKFNTIHSKQLATILTQYIVYIFVLFGTPYQNIIVTDNNCCYKKTNAREVIQIKNT